MNWLTGISLDRYIAFVLNRRWSVLALTAVVALALTAGTRHLGVTNEYRSLFDERNPQLIALNTLENTYSSSDAALIAIAPREGSVFTREVLGAIQEMTDTAWRAPYASRVDSLTNYSHSRASEDTLTVAPLVEDAGSLDDDELVEIRDIALGASELAGRQVSFDGRVAGLMVTINLPQDREAAIIEVTDYLRAALDEAREKYPSLNYYLTGDLVLNRAMGEALADDFSTLGPIALSIIVLVTVLLLRSVWGTVSILLMLLFVVGSGMGFTGWAGLKLSGANSTAPMIMMIITVAHSVHVVGTVISAMSQGLDRNAAIAASLRSNTWPVFLTSLTTAIGFLSLNFSDTPPFRILGNIVAFGVVCAFVYSVTLLPALLSILPVRARSEHDGPGEFFDRFGAFVVAHRIFLLWCVALVAVALVTGVPRLQFSETWTELFDESYEFRRDTDFVNENLTGLEMLEYSLNAEHEGGITDPEYLRKVDAFAEWYRKQPEVSHVQAFPDIMKRLNKNMHDDDPAFYRLPEDPELSAQYLLLYELSLPFGRDLNNRIDIRKSATRMTVVLRRVSAQEQIEVDRRAQAWIRENAPSLESVASGTTVIFAHFAQTNIEGMLRGTITAMAIVSFLLIFVFRSLRLGLISLVPNFIPAAMAFGLWGYLVGNVGVAASIVTVIAFGIVVDDTIHFMTKYVRARKQGLSPSESVRSTFRAVGHALWTTTAVFALGFLAFAASALANNRALGLLVGITIVIALIADFLLLPPLLMALERIKKR